MRVKVVYFCRSLANAHSPVVDESEGRILTAYMMMVCCAIDLLTLFISHSFLSSRQGMKKGENHDDNVAV